MRSGNRKVEQVLRCQYCGANVDLPFKCPFCSGYFCAEHRLPENHLCSELQIARARGPPPAEEHRPSAESKPQLPIGEGSSGYPFRFEPASWTSSTEMAHLTAGALIVMGVGLSLSVPSFRWSFPVLGEPVVTLTSALIFTLIFMSHELAHKTAAKRHGLWAEFRLSLMGAALTLMSIGPTPIKIVSPGAVMIAGSASRKTVGLIALAGPFTSFVFTLLLFVLYPLIPDSSFSSVFLRGAMLASWMTLLNLIPFGILDGAKVYWWNKLVWAVSFSASLVMMVVILGYPFS